MKFKTKPGDLPTLKYKDNCGDKLEAFIAGDLHDDGYALVLWTARGNRVGMPAKKAVKFAKAILKELGE